MFAFILFLPFVCGTYTISLYGDVYKDIDFFSKTYPWLIDNIGGEISIDYYLLGSGRYSVPHMCALEQLRMNPFLQAQYLKCEAEGTNSELCLCESGIDASKYKHCVLTKGSYARQSSFKYQQLGIDASPIIEMGYKNTVFGVEDSWYLKKICTMFGDNAPRGCIAPFGCNATEEYSSRKGVVSFNCACLVCHSDTTASIETPTTITTPYPRHYTNRYYTDRFYDMI